MEAAGIGRRRLVNQQITHHPSMTPAEVVTALGAVQAQDFVGARWAVALRLPGATEADIERALADGAIVRTWPMRGTLHFVAAADARWMLKLLAPRVVSGNAARLSRMGLDEREIRRGQAVMIEALAGGRRLTRNELYQRLDEAGIATGDQRGLHLLWRSAHDGLICFGPLVGKQQAIVLLEEWLPPAPEPTREEALARLAARYFTSHGPATLPDLARWAGLTVADTRLGIDGASDRLARETHDGEVYYLPASQPPAPPDAPRAQLLPSWDEYLVAYKSRDAVLDPRHSQRVIPGSNGMFLPVLVLDGQAAGTWKRRLVGDRLTVAVEPFVSLGEDERRAVEAAAQRYAAYLNLTSAETTINP